MTSSRTAGFPTRTGWTLALTAVGFFMVALDALVVITALPAIHHELSAGISTLDWTVNAYALAFAAGIITAAALGDRFGRRRMYIAGLLLFTAASGACALAPDAEVLIAARAIQGLGGAIVTPLSLTILTSAFPASRRGSIVGIWGGMAGLAIAGGPLIGGAVTEGLSWHWIFWVNVPIGLVAAALATRRLPESYGPSARLDLPGAALVSAGAVATVWAMVHAAEVGWAHVDVFAPLLGGLALLGAFLAWERRAPEPMLPLHLFQSRTFSAANASAFLMTGAIFSAAFLVSQFFQLALGDSPLNTGLRILPWTATPLIVAPLAGTLSDRIGSRPLIVVGLLLQALGLSWFALVGTEHVAYLQLVLPLLVAGVGVSMAIPTTTTAVLGAVHPDEIGKASGVSNTLQRFGGAFGIAIVSAVFLAHGHLGTPLGVEDGFRPALAVSALLSLLGAVSAVAITNPRTKIADVPVQSAEWSGARGEGVVVNA